MSRVLLMVGTQKGAFFLWSDEAREEWRVEGPLLKGWEVSCLELDSRGEPTIYGGVGHFVYGATIHFSKDFGESWTQLEKGPAYGEGDARKLHRVWAIAPGHPDEPKTLYAGVDEAGLFVSKDGGSSWQGVDGLNDHPTREAWTPGAGGLCCHTILLDPLNRERLWVGISAVGVFRTDDGGASWQLKTEGLPVAEPNPDHPGVGSCVHKLTLVADSPSVLYQQNHMGVFRSTDAGDHWQRIETGLPSRFGFPMVIHPADPKTLFVIPQESDEYRFFVDGQPAVYRTSDGGESWHSVGDGLPTRPTYAGVLRNAMAVDRLDPCGVYFGTTGGQLFSSNDAGDTWLELPCQLPRIASVTAVLVEG